MTNAMKPPSPTMSLLREYAKAVATKLDRRIAAALKATAGSTGPLGGTVIRLNSIHKAFKAQLASGQLTEALYAQKARELLNILRNFDGLIAEAASTGVRASISAPTSAPTENFGVTTTPQTQRHGGLCFQIRMSQSISHA